MGLWEAAGRGGGGGAWRGRMAAGVPGMEMCFVMHNRFGCGARWRQGRMAGDVFCYA